MSDRTDDVDVIDPNEELEVIIESDAPPEDQNKDPIPDDQQEDPSEEELSQLSEKVQKRIAKLTAEKHDQRRKREAAEREAAESAKALQTMLAKEQQYRETLLKYEGGFVNQAKGRVEAELTAAKDRFKKAFEIGDADAMAEAQDQIARLAPQHEQYSRYKPREPEPVYQPPKQPEPPAHDPASDQNLQQFLKDNKWFNTDEEMTAYAMGLHQQVALRDPSYVGTADYYEEIASKVRTTFASRLKPASEKTATRSSPVAPVTRSTGAPARKQIRLTESQVRLASRLGITPQQYAEQILRQEQN